MLGLGHVRPTRSEMSMLFSSSNPQRGAQQKRAGNHCVLFMLVPKHDEPFRTSLLNLRESTLTLFAQCGEWKKKSCLPQMAAHRTHRNLQFRVVSDLVSLAPQTLDQRTQTCWCCGFYHCHKQAGCWLAATYLSRLVHKHTNCVIHTLWQLRLVDLTPLVWVDEQLVKTFHCRSTGE